MDFISANVGSSVGLNGPLIPAAGGLFPGTGDFVLFCAVFCFFFLFLVFFLSHKTGQALPAYSSPNCTGIGQLPNLLTSKVNSWGGREGRPRPFSSVDSEVLLKMLCFLEACTRPNQKKKRKKAREGQRGAGSRPTSACSLPAGDPQPQALQEALLTPVCLLPVTGPGLLLSSSGIDRWRLPAGWGRGGQLSSCPSPQTLELPPPLEKDHRQTRTWHVRE